MTATVTRSIPQLDTCASTMAAALDGLLSEVGALAAKLAAREEIARCLRDDYLELGDRVERLLRERDTRSRRGQGLPAGSGVAQVPVEEVSAPQSQLPQGEERDQEQAVFRKLLPREFVQQRAYVSKLRDEWRECHQHAVDAASAAQSDFVAHVAMRSPAAAGNAAPAGPRHAHAQRIAISRAYDHLYKLLSILPRPPPEPAAMDPAATWAETSDEALVRLCIMVRVHLLCCTVPHCLSAPSTLRLTDGNAACALGPDYLHPTATASVR